MGSNHSVIGTPVSKNRWNECSLFLFSNPLIKSSILWSSKRLMTPARGFKSRRRLQDGKNNGKQVCHVDASI